MHPMHATHEYLVWCLQSSGHRIHMGMWKKNGFAKKFQPIIKCEHSKLFVDEYRQFGAVRFVRFEPDEARFIQVEKWRFA